MCNLQGKNHGLRCLEALAELIFSLHSGLKLGLHVLCKAAHFAAGCLCVAELLSQALGEVLHHIEFILVGCKCTTTLM